MTTIEVFEPALCCATGVCGEDVDQQLVTFSADMEFIRSNGDWLTTWRPPQSGPPRERLAAMTSRTAKGFRDSPDFIRLGLMLMLERRPVEPRADDVPPSPGPRAQRVAHQLG